jgi:hypothetical protein
LGHLDLLDPDARCHLLSRRIAAGRSGAEIHENEIVLAYKGLAESELGHGTQLVDPTGFAR